jgi:hypothetical protein
MAVVQSSKDKMNIIMSTPPPCRQGSEFSRISLLHPLSPLPLSLSRPQYASTVVNLWGPVFMAS